MSMMDRPFKRIAIAAVLSLLSMSVLPACEKGLMLKDPKITAPDFEVKVQAPDAPAGERAAFVIDLKAVNVSDSTSADQPEDIQYTAMIEFGLGLKDQPDTHSIKTVNAVVKSSNQFNSNGKIESLEGEPAMMWKAKCADALCEKFYVSILFDFKDSEGRVSDMKMLVIGIDGTTQTVKRHLFDYDQSLITVAAQIEALEKMDPETVTMKQAGDVPAENEGADELRTEQPVNPATTEQDTQVEPIVAPTGVDTQKPEELEETPEAAEQQNDADAASQSVETVTTSTQSSEHTKIVSDENGTRIDTTKSVQHTDKNGNKFDINISDSTQE